MKKIWLCLLIILFISVDFAACSNNHENLQGRLKELGLVTDPIIASSTEAVSNYQELRVGLFKKQSYSIQEPKNLIRKFIDALYSQEYYLLNELKYNTVEADTTVPVFYVYYKYITISNIKNINQCFRDNVKGKIIDNCDGEIPIEKMQFIGKIKNKPGVYKIKYVVEDSSGNQAEETVYYFYKLTPKNMKKPFYFVYNGEKHILANKWVPAPKKFKPGANKTARKKLNEMLAAMKKAGVGVKVKSGFRSYSTQAKMWKRSVKRYGKTKTARVLAKPGYSEHQTGFTYDIGLVSTSFAKTEAYTWLQEHAHEYGFILRYPKSAEAITGYSYEPWHYRYLGVDLATAIYNERHKEGGNPDLTLEEFIGYTRLN